MNILVVTSLYPGYPNEPYSDIPYVVHYFCKEWISQGHNVKVINSRLKYPRILNIFNKFKKKNRFMKDYRFILDDISVFRVPIVYYPKVGIDKHSTVLAAKKVHKFLKEDNFIPDVIISHMINPSLFLAVKLKKIYHVPLTLTLHAGDIEFLKDKSSAVKLKSYNQFINLYGFRSNRIFDEFHTLFSQLLNNKKTFIAHSGIPKSNIINEEELIKKVKLSTNNILTVSTLIKRKNVDSIIRAVGQFSRNQIENITIVGDGEEKDTLKSLAKRYFIEGQVRFIPHLTRESIMDLMYNYSIFVLISSQETLGMVYLEAMAKGCIVIASKNEGIDGIIIDGFNGFLCEAGNEEELKKIIEKVLNLSEKEKMDILRNSLHTIRNLTEERVSRDYIENISSIL